MFELVAGFAGAEFSLTGPNGWAGFSAASGSSSLVTLPSTGTYQLEVNSNGATQGNYVFLLNQTLSTAIDLATPTEGTVSGAGYSHLFQFDLTEANPLFVTLNSLVVSGFEVNLKRGSAPTRRSYDYRSNLAGGDQRIVVPVATPGTWHALVYSSSLPAGTQFTLLANQLPILADHVSPALGAVGETETLTVTGVGFFPGTTVALVSTAGTVFASQSHEIDNTTKILARFDLSSVPEGTYDVQVTAAGGATSIIPDAFVVVPPGEPNLETRLIMPPALGRHALGTIYVEYANTGTRAMAAPLLTLASADPDGSDRPLLTLDASNLSSGFWTSAIPDGFANSVQIMGNGATPGLLMPGERMQVPVYFAGLQTPWDSRDSQIEMEILIADTTSDIPIDWPTFEVTLQPEWISDDAWSIVFDNLQTQIGHTWGNYSEMISDNASYLVRFGEIVADVSALYNFELQQAIGYSPVGYLASTVDVFVPAPGIDLTFARSYADSVLQRHEMGTLGRGWVGSWQSSLQLDSAGVVFISDEAGVERRFQPDSRKVGRFFADPSDQATLTQLANGTYELRERTGEVTRFRSDGTLQSFSDPNGNRIATTFQDDQLVRLDHSSGAFLVFQYNGAGLLSQIDDSLGRTTTYAYDAATAQLLSVTTTQGTTRFAYDTSAEAAKLHALTSITDESGVIQTFEYDATGRLSATYTGTNTNRFSYSYDTAGTITTTDPAGIVTRVFVDHTGLTRRFDSSTGYYINYQYNEGRRVTRTTDVLGREEILTYAPNGAVSRIRDVLGNDTQFLTGGPHALPTRFIDANGNETRYAYDENGNLLATTYADGTVEGSDYDAAGNPIQSFNRRGHTVNRTFNDAGQVLTETFSDGTIHTYSYNAGRLDTVTGPEGTTQFSYDAKDRVTRVDYPKGRWLAYEYDAAGRRTRLTDNTGFVTAYVYDSAGRLSQLRTASDERVVEYVYDSAGRISRENKGNGTYSVFGFDANNRLTTIHHYAPDNTVNSSFVYEYDILGRRTSMDTIDGKWTYRYDLSGQLIGAVFASTNSEIPDQGQTYVYDALGNRVRTILNGVTTEYVTNLMNQYTSAGETSFAYDLDGNLIQEAGPDGTKSYTFNSRNQLVGITTVTDAATYAYDVLGNRVTTSFNDALMEAVWDPFGLPYIIADYDDSGVATAHYNVGLGIEAVNTGSGQHFFDHDAIGSTAGTSDLNATYSDRNVYDPYGVPLYGEGTPSLRLRYIGQTGILTSSIDTAIRARSYSPEHGRFLSQDPIRLRGGDDVLYGYVNNSPIDYFDPTGLGPETDPQAVCFAFALSCHFTGGPFVQLFCVATDVACLLGPILIDPQPPQGPFGPPPVRGPSVWNMPPTSSPNEPERPDSPPLFQNPTPTPPPGGTGNNNSSGTAGAIDPNEKFGDPGFGLDAFVRGGSTVPYRINFENLGPGSVPAPTRPATAPAQRVEVTDQLSNDLDWTTFQFTEFGFGDTIVDVTDLSTHVFQVVPMSINGQEFDVEVELDFNSTTGFMTVVFQSINPLTELPPDVLTGFLPPEDGTGRGMGHLSYRVQAKPNLLTGTEIRNIALIVFDGQDAIATNQIDPQDPSAGTSADREALNTIDSGKPNSQIDPLPETSHANTVVLTWAGEDDANGSGIRSYDIYVSRDNSPFERLASNLSETTMTFAGINGSSYRFYSVATDNVGNSEDVPNAFDAQTTIRSAIWKDPLSSVFEGVEWNLNLEVGVSDSDQALTFTSDDSRLVFPTTFVIPSGQSQVSITVRVSDDTTLSGDKSASFAVHSFGNELLTGTIDIADDEAVAPFRNPINALDVNRDGQVVPLDVLKVINRLNSFGSGALVWDRASIPAFYFDTNGDNFVSPSDARLVIDFLNQPAGGEGEAGFPIPFAFSNASNRELILRETGNTDLHAAVASLPVHSRLDENVTSTLFVSMSSRTAPLDSRLSQKDEFSLLPDLVDAALDDNHLGELFASQERGLGKTHGEET